ncbi:Glycosyltransferase involved in cell wall bisynthesis [Kytococcus aerolatus]|uniref:Glycosyltransferase involved in cell wall bisynthesis n=1 Tax=Kytococcus aerolatus TaxID=592308 RepID=A0A212TH43_9MICO|nr:Glycosyltransferase involved in cell wall bisynthesis [Kytococcus aerolatus]
MGGPALHAWLATVETEPIALLTTALRTEDVVLEEAMARAATHGAMSMDELAQHVVRAATLAEVLAPTAAGPASSRVRERQRRREVGLVACVAGYWCARSDRPGSPERGLRLLEAVLEAHHPRLVPRKMRSIPVQQALLSGRVDLAREWVDLPGARPSIVHGARVDLEHLEPGDAWLERFNEPFTSSGCTPITLTGVGPTPFDRMEAATPRRVEEGPLVSVIMPCYRPDEGLFTSVRSILAQTWQPLEVIVLDDASGPGYAGLFERVAALDERIRVVHLAENGGSYLARNHGIALCRGEFVTVQDADDWSHPERIERHVRDLLEHPEAPANRSRAMRVREDLTHQWLGYPPHRLNASSLMVRREVFDTAGLFQAVRKGADSEYHFRLNALGTPVREVRAHVAVIRLSAGSLSRGDFRWHRNNPDRLLYRAVYAAWHRALVREAGGEGEPALRRAAVSGIEDPRTPPFPVPRAWNRDLPSARGRHPGADEVVTHPWVLRGDFSQPRRADQVRELLAAGIRPVLWHQEAALPLTEKRQEVSEVVADLVVAEQLPYISSHEPTRAENLVVLDAGVASREVGVVRADAVWVDADRLLEDPDPTFPTDLTAVPAQLGAALGVEPRWVTRHRPGECAVEGAVPVPWGAPS